MNTQNIKSHWILPEGYTDSDVLEHEGFVYLITNLLNGKMYIGKKFVWSRRSQKQANGRKKWLPKTESQWQTYKSSSKNLLHVIDKVGVENFRFEIIGLYKTRCMTNFREVQEQMKRDVLYAVDNAGQYIYYNENIACKYFRPK